MSYLKIKLDKLHFKKISKRASIG